MSRTALGTMTQRLPHLGVSSASSGGLLSHQMSCRLEVRGQLDAFIEVPGVLLLRHGPGVSALGAPTHLGSTMPSPPRGFSHKRSVLRVSLVVVAEPAIGGTRTAPRLGLVGDLRKAFPPFQMPSDPRHHGSGPSSFEKVPVGPSAPISARRTGSWAACSTVRVPRK